MSLVAEGTQKSLDEAMSILKAIQTQEDAELIVQMKNGGVHKIMSNTALKFTMVDIDKQDPANERAKGMMRVA